MLEAPSRIERLAEPFSLTPDAAAAVAVASAVGTAPGRSASRVNGWAVSLVTPAAVAPGVDWFLSFRNFYTAFIRVDLLLDDEQTATLVDGLPLMQRLHCEDDAQNWHVVKLELTSLAGLELTGRTLVGVRVYCRQPSPLWAKWELHSLKLYHHEKAHNDTATTVMKGIESDRVTNHDTLTARTSRGPAELATVSEQVADDSTRSVSSATAVREDHGNSLTQLHPTSVDDQAVRCLDLMLRLHQLFAPPAASSF